MELHRKKVADLARSLFMTLDGRVAEAIGFEGSIMEEIYKRKAPRGKNGDINVEGLDPNLRGFILKSGFSFNVRDSGSGKHLSYSIDCSDGIFHPTITAPTNDGRLKFEVLTGPSDNEFDMVRITRYVHNSDGSFSHAREVRTFVPNFRAGESAYPLTIEDLINSKTREQRSVLIRYENLDVFGNTEIPDGEKIGIIPIPGYYGVFSKDQRKILWRQNAFYSPATVGIVENTLLISHEGDQWEFPIRANIYEELRTITLGTLQLPPLK